MGSNLGAVIVFIVATDSLAEQNIIRFVKLNVSICATSSSFLRKPFLCADVRDPRLRQREQSETRGGLCFAVSLSHPGHPVVPAVHGGQVCSESHHKVCLGMLGILCLVTKKICSW